MLKNTMLFNVYLLKNKLPHLIIIIFAVLHLYGITHPPLDHHGHRQSDTMEVARSFVEEDSTPFYPKVARRAELTGITGLEFPIFNYLVSVGLLAREYVLTNGKGISFDENVEHKTFNVYRIITPGHYEAIGRLLSLLFAIIGLICFYKLMIFIQGANIAIYSLLALTGSMTWFYFSRSIQPDVPATAMGVCGIYFICLYLEEAKKLKKFIYISIAAITFSLCGLMKAPALALLFPAAYLVFQKRGLKAFWDLNYYWFAALILLPLFFWLKHAVYLTSEYKLNYFFLGRPLLDSISQIFGHRFMWAFFKRTFQEYTSWALAPFFIYGLYKLWGEKQRLFYAFWFLGFAASALKSGEHITVHDYYALPIVPLFCAFAGIGLYYGFLARPKIKLAAIALIYILLPIHLNQVYRMECPYLIGLEKRLHGLVPYSSRVAVDGGYWPVHLYMIHRKGWTMIDGFASDSKIVNDMRTKGLEYIILTRGFNRSLLEELYQEKVILSEPDLMVIKL